MILFRRKGDKKKIGEPGEFKGYFMIMDVFDLRIKGIAGFLVLAGLVVNGTLDVGDFLILPDGRILKVTSLEVRRRKVEHVDKGVPVGVAVEGVGWKPDKRDFKPYLGKSIMERLRKELEEKYKGVPEGAREELVKRELGTLLEMRAKAGEIKELLRIHAPKF